MFTIICKLSVARRHGPVVSRSRGFSMVELIIVMVILGVLSVYIAPNLQSAYNMQKSAAVQEIAGVLRYARDVAMTRARVVCVEVNQNGVPGIVLKMATANPASSCDHTLLTPAGSAVFFNARPITINIEQTPISNTTFYIHPTMHVSNGLTSPYSNHTTLYFYVDGDISEWATISESATVFFKHL